MRNAFVVLLASSLLSACTAAQATDTAQTQGRELLRISFKRTADGLRQWTPAMRWVRGPARNRLIEALIACKERR